MLRRTGSLSFSEKQQSVKGIFSVVLSAVAFVICIVAIVISYNKKGSAGTVIGSCGIMALLSSFMGLLFGIAGMLEGNRKRLTALAGMIFGGVIFVGLIILFIKGF